MRAHDFAERNTANEGTTQQAVSLPVNRLRKLNKARVRRKGCNATKRKISNKKKKNFTMATIV